MGSVYSDADWDIGMVCVSSVGRVWEDGPVSTVVDCSNPVGSSPVGSTLAGTVGTEHLVVLGGMEDVTVGLTYNKLQSARFYYNFGTPVNVPHIAGDGNETDCN